MIKLETINGVADDDKSPSDTRVRYDAPAITTGGAESKGRDDRMLSAAATAQPRPSDSGSGHDYEELNDPYSPRTPPLNGYLVPVENSIATSHAGASNPTAAVHDARPRPEFRRRDNPLYVSMSGEKSRDANHVTSTGACSLRCLLILVVTCLILATAAVALATISIVILFTGGRGEAMQSCVCAEPRLQERNNRTTAADDSDDLVLSQLNQTRQHIETMIQQLTDNVTHLRAQTGVVLESQSTSEMSRDELSKRLDRMETNFNVSQSNLLNIKNELSDMDSSLSNRIYNVSKMSGPQGPPGVGNLSACIHDIKQSGSSIQSDKTLSPSLDLTEPGPYQYWVITGLTCTTVNGIQALLTYTQPSTYHCVCRGSAATTSARDSRFCILHYWICPLIS